jgi:hypothetical protein
MTNTGFLHVNCKFLNLITVLQDLINNYTNIPAVEKPENR